MSTTPKASPAPARPAATILLLRDRPAGIEVFMVVRHHEIDFASGALVFPGGRVELEDYTIAAAHAGGVTPEDAALRVAAVRETYEECGVLLARPSGEANLIDAARLLALEPRRAALCRGETSFAELLAAEDLYPALDQLVHFAHWITPATQPKRFDTHFFLAAAPEDHLAVHDGAEAVDSAWIRPNDSLADAEASLRKVIFPTRMNLAKLARSTTVEASLAAARCQAVVTVRPEFVRAVEGGRELRLPLAAGYGGELFIAREPKA